MAAANIDVPRGVEFAEILRRRKARSSLVEYARLIDIPGKPATKYDEAGEDAYLNDYPEFTPIETAVVAHHRVVLEAIEQTMQTVNGRLMIMAPPGSAKSTYADIVATTWAMGRWPGYRIILASYATKLARKQSRKAQQICRSREYSSLWAERPVMRKDIGAADEWALTNGSEYMAAGILAGITGNRANGVICDDLIAGREEAESPTIREKTMEAYRDDVESRLLPGGWIILINTRWHMEDPSGSILPDNYAGESGYLKGKDGREWLVINIPAKAERADDPVGRKVGEYLWPEWFPASHWQAFENDPLGRRRWASLYQGRPTADAGEDFKAEWFDMYEPRERPPLEELELYGASDFAVTEVEPEKQRRNQVDWSEHGVVGMDERGDLWFLDWWSGQVETDKSIEAAVAMFKRWKPHGLRRWWDEGGTIDKAVRPAWRRAMREAKCYVTVESLPRIADKRAKCSSFQARASARTVHFPAGATWPLDVIAQLTGFPGHRWDDKYDVCGLIGRGIDKMAEGKGPKPPAPVGIKPFTAEWLEYDETAERKGKRYV